MEDVFSVKSEFLDNKLTSNGLHFRLFINLGSLKIHVFFISNTFTSFSTLKLAKNQANSKQHPEAELLLFEKYSPSSLTLSSKNNRIHSKK